MALFNKMKNLLRCVMSVVNSSKFIFIAVTLSEFLQFKSQKHNQMTSSHILMPSRNDERKLQNEEICKYKNELYEYSIKSSLDI